MSRYYEWPLINFRPEKIANIREKLEKKWGSEELPKVELSSWGWERLIEEIRSLPDEHEAIQAYANQSKRRYISVLSYQFLGVPIEVKDKVGAILLYRISRAIVKNAWVQFQVEPDIPILVKVLKAGFDSDYSPFKGQQAAEKVWKQSFEEDYSLDDAVKFVATFNGKFSEAISELKVSLNSKLESILLINSWQKGNRETFLREEPTFIVEQLRKMPIETVATIIDRYFKVMDSINQIQKEIGDYLHRQYGRPDGKGHSNNRPHVIWEQVSTASQAKFLQWIFAKLIDIALTGDRERLAYWRKQVDQVDEVVVEQDLSLLVLYFRNHVIVEFMARGNALYCYEKEVYSTIIRPRVIRTQRKNKEVFKDQLLVFERLIHTGGWQWKADHLIRTITRG